MGSGRTEVAELSADGCRERERAHVEEKLTFVPSLSGDHRPGNAVRVTTPSGCHGRDALLGHLAKRRFSITG